MELDLSKLPLAVSGLSNEDYHSGPGLSSTQLSTIANKSLAHLLCEEKKVTRSMDFGTYLHTAILEPHLLDEEYICTDEVAPQRNTKEGKKIFAQWKEENPDRNVTDSDSWKREWFSWKYPHKKRVSKEWQSSLQIIRGLIDNHPIKEYLACGQKEISIFWNQEVNGEKILSKAKPDLLLNNNMLIDFKTTEDASNKGINASIRKWNYHWSLAYHARGIKAVTGVDVPAAGWIFIERNNPYAINMKQMPTEMWDYANDCIDSVLHKYIEEKKNIENSECFFPYGKEWTYAEEQIWMTNQAEKILR